MISPINEVRHQTTYFLRCIDPPFITRNVIRAAPNLIVNVITPSQRFRFQTNLRTSQETPLKGSLAPLLLEQGYNFLRKKVLGNPHL